MYVIIHKGSGSKLGSFADKQNAEEYAQAFRERRGIQCQIEIIPKQELLSDSV